MKGRSLLITCLVFALLAFFSPSADTQLQPPSLWGSLYIHMPNSRYPYPAAGYQVFLYRRDIGWSRPSFTDGYGRYAHYSVPPGRYLMRVLNYANLIVWQQEVSVPSQVPPIVMPNP